MMNSRSIQTNFESNLLFNGAPISFLIDNKEIIISEIGDTVIMKKEVYDSILQCLKQYEKKDEEVKRFIARYANKIAI